MVALSTMLPFIWLRLRSPISCTPRGLGVALNKSTQGQDNNVFTATLFLLVNGSDKLGHLLTAKGDSIGHCCLWLGQILTSERPTPLGLVNHHDAFLAQPGERSKGRFGLLLGLVGSSKLVCNVLLTCTSTNQHFDDKGHETLL